MVWSYSRISAYENCPYGFFMKYIKKLKGKRLFFSDYGSFIHQIIQKYLTGELRKEELVDYYLSTFRRSVIGKAPSSTIFKNYFSDGIKYLETIPPLGEELIGVEKKVSFSVGDKPFVGIIDKVSRTSEGICITDNKSRALKERSGRRKPTKSDEELDNYLRQLYLYAIAIENEFLEKPKYLIFNCFRTRKQIVEPFRDDDYEQTKVWALGSIKKITETDEWNPKLDAFKCRNLCEFCDLCEYFEMYSK